MASIIYPAAHFLVKNIYAAVAFSLSRQLFQVLHSLFKAGAGLLKIGKVYVLGTPSSECIYKYGD